MTTIVVDRRAGFIAADRQTTTNDNDVAVEGPKIRQIEFDDGVHLVACAGDEGPIETFFEWYEYSDDWQSEPIDLYEDEQLTALILTPKCQLLVCDHHLRPYEVLHRYYAAGSGGGFAWAILEAGVGIDKAMRTAIKMDPHSGFGYDIEYIAEVNGE